MLNPIEIRTLNQSLCEDSESIEEKRGMKKVVFVFFSIAGVALLAELFLLPKVLFKKKVIAENLVNGQAFTVEKAGTYSLWVCTEEIGFDELAAISPTIVNIETQEAVQLRPILFRTKVTGLSGEGRLKVKSFQAKAGSYKIVESNQHYSRPGNILVGGSGSLKPLTYRIKERSQDKYLIPFALLPQLVLFTLLRGLFYLVNN